MQYLCRDCFHYWEDNLLTESCPGCYSEKLLKHLELFSLDVAHLDCDSFYTSVEKRDDPKISSLPVIVGRRERGVVAAACYVARIYGVRSGMAMFQALRLCPNAHVISPNMDKYKVASHGVRRAMREVTAKIEPVSIDEAYLDLSDNAALHNEPACVSLVRLVDTISRTEKITVSIGLSYNKFLSKLASDLDKPKGFYVIGRVEARSFLSKLPVRKLWGVGPSAVIKMTQHGYMTIGHVQDAKLEDLMRIFGKSGYGFYLFANGEDNRKFGLESKTKSVSAETTFLEDLSSLDDLLAALESLSEQVAKRLRLQNLSGRVVVIKLKDSNFRNATRSKKYGKSFTDKVEIREAAEQLLLHYWDSVGRSKLLKVRGFRLLGVGISDLVGEADDVHDMFDFSNTEPIRSKSELVRVIEEIKIKFGEGAIGLRSQEYLFKR